MHRAYHAIPPLTTTSGEQVNAIFGFTSLFLRALADLKPTHIAFTFDMSGPTFRHQMSSDYKATRQKMDEDLAQQIPRLKEVAQAFGFPIFELESFEADDLIGTLAVRATQDSHDMNVYIMTADMDATQLINSRVFIYTAKQKISEVITYDEAGVEAKYNGLKPNQIVDYKALRGDTSDNIPGVPGIGEKTATDLLLKYQHLDQIYEHLAELKDRTRMLLEQGRDSAYLSYKLATINTNAPIKLDIDQCAAHRFDVAKVTELFRQLEFSSLISRLPAAQINGATAVAEESAAPARETKYQLVNSADQLRKVLAEATKAGTVAIDTETTSLDVWTGTLLGLSLSYQPHHGYYIPVARWSQSLLKEWLANPKVAKIAHNAKFDLQVLNVAKLPVSKMIFDTMLAAFILKEGMGKFGLKELAFTELGIQATPISELIGTGPKQITMDAVDPDKVAQYAAADADHTFQLYQIYSQQLKQQPKLLELFEQIEMPVMRALVDIESNGIRLDSEFLTRMSGEYQAELTKLEKNIYQAVGHEFNLNSPRQLADVLFDELKLPANKKTKTGRSTDESVLQSLKSAHPVVELLLRYRELFKLKSTYIDALPSLISPYDKRLHTSYNQAVAATGRLSSNNPNLQNIPIRTEQGRRIRQAFLANEGHQLVSIDYSQIELRILAHVSSDPALLSAFAQGQDVHTATAAKVFNCTIDQVTSDQRRAAKTINFGIMYGQSAFGLAQQLDISREEANKFIQEYFGVYSEVKRYLDQAIIKARQDGYVETLFGRRRRIPELSSSNFNIRWAGERMAINMPIQGTAADIIKKAMITIQDYLVEKQAKSQMLLQVHDELVFTIDPAESDELIPEISRQMEQAADLTVKLEVEAKVGENWGQMTVI